MKKIKIIVIISILLCSALAGALIGISIWANKPRGIRVELDQLIK